MKQTMRFYYLMVEWKQKITNNKGYIKNNIIIISWRANRCKTDMSMIELEILVKNLKWLALEKGFI